MRIYVAGKTTQLERVRDMMDELHVRGHDITFDWTKNPETGIRHDWSDYPLQAAERASGEVDAVLSADLVILLYEATGLGSLFEAGIAIGARIPTIVVTSTRESVFFYLPWVKRVHSDHDVLEVLRHLEGGIFDTRHRRQA